MRKTLLLILTPILLSNSAFAEDPTGWKDVPWRSGPEAFEGREEKFQKLTENKEVFLRGEKLRALFALEEYRVAGIPYQVTLLFDHANRFAAYKLHHDFENPGTAQEAYWELHRLLEKKYKSTRTVSSTGIHTYGSFQLVKSTLSSDPQASVHSITVTYLDTNDDEIDKL